MNKLDGLSMDIEMNDREKLRSIFPECFTEGKLDINKLLNMCGEYIIDDSERYEFKWKGKSKCLQLAQQRSTGTLRPCPDESVNFDSTQNIYIEGDNLEVLKLLQSSYYRSIKMIYIDPPYNTGKDFVYSDDFKDPIARYKEVTEQTTKSNVESMGRYHTNWLNMMYPRLRLAANLLRDDGVIFISIDDNEVHNLRKVCDEVFGEENFVGTILWKKKTNGNNMGLIPPVHDYIVLYARQISCIQDIGYEVSTDFIKKTYSNSDNDARGPWTTMDLSANHEGPHFKITNPSTGEEFEPPVGRYWVFNEKEVLRRIEEGRIIFGKSGTSRPVQKVFALERSTSKIKAESWWDNHGLNADATKEIKELMEYPKLFTHPKPSKLLYHLAKMFTDCRSSDIILDFFSGSATTAHAVMQLNAENGGNRQFIMVQLPEACDEKSEAYKAGYKNICEIGKERIRRAGAKLLKEEISKTEKFKEQLPLMEDTELEQTPLDIGFKVFKLDTSNVKTWDSSTITDDNLLPIEKRMNSMIERVKDSRSDMDVVYEIMLKLGIPLTEKICEIDIAGKAAYLIGDEATLLISLAFGITPEHVEKMAEYQPKKIVLAEQGLLDDSVLANAHYILKDRNIELDLV